MLDKSLRTLGMLLVAALDVTAQEPGVFRFEATSLALRPPVGAFQFHDFSGDGEPDVLSASYEPGLLSTTSRIYLNQGDGSLGNAVTETASGFSFEYADFDGDGCADRARQTWEEVWVARGLCDGTFGPETRIHSKDVFVNAMTVADVDSDGWPDILVNDADFVGNLYLYRNTGGAFAVSDQAQCNSNFNLLHGDFNGDGALDVYSDGESGAAFQIQVSPGELGVEVSGSGLIGFLWDCGFAVELNGVGGTELLCCVSQSPGHKSLMALTNIDPAPGTTYLLGALWIEAFDLTGHSSLAVLDLDGDLVADLVTLDAAHDLWISRGIGDGRFRESEYLSATAYSSAFASGKSDFAFDLSGDGVLDLIVPEGDALLVLENLTEPSAFQHLSGKSALDPFPPTLGGSGSTRAGGHATLELLHGPRSSAVMLVVGSSQLGLPLLGGLLVPTPEWVVTNLVTNARGTWSATVPWTLPPGSELYLQAWYPEAGAPQGFAASNGLRVRSY